MNFLYVDDDPGKGILVEKYGDELCKNNCKTWNSYINLWAWWNKNV